VLCSSNPESLQFDIRKDKKMNTLAEVMGFEGFSRTPYIDPLVAKNPEAHGISEENFEIIKNDLSKLKLTFGYGFTSIEEDEAKVVLNMRLNKISNELMTRIPFYNKLNSDIKEMLTMMAYQMGVDGLLGFEHMLKAIEEEDWCEAYEEGKDSKWFRETPNRATAVLKPLKDNCGNF